MNARFCVLLASQPIQPLLLRVSFRIPRTKEPSAHCRAPGIFLSLFMFALSAVSPSTPRTKQQTTKASTHLLSSLDGTREVLNTVQKTIRYLRRFAQGGLGMFSPAEIFSKNAPAGHLSILPGVRLPPRDNKQRTTRSLQSPTVTEAEEFFPCRRCRAALRWLRCAAYRRDLPARCESLIWPSGVLCFKQRTTYCPI
jgi:hypothetical protein